MGFQQTLLYGLQDYEGSGQLGVGAKVGRALRVECGPRPGRVGGWGPAAENNAALPRLSGRED